RCPRRAIRAWFPAGSTTSAVWLAKEGILSQERFELLLGIKLGYRQRIWASLPGANIAPHRVSTMREKSQERRMLLSRSFHLSGRRRVAFSVFRCFPATAADRPSASIGTAMSLDTLRARMAAELSYGP